MHEALAALVDSLLYEGYALYPYTPGATKNATPTPFGIVYPPAYAVDSAVTFDHLRLDCVLETADDALLTGTALFLQPSGKRHQGVPRKLEIGPVAVSKLAAGQGEEFNYSAEGAEAPDLDGRVRLRAVALEDGRWRVRMCVHNTTAVEIPPDGMDRSQALLASMISTHVVVESSAGQFVSPLERDGEAGAAVAGCESVNTFPVLASPRDDAILGAAIVLPDHPKLAPESLGNLFDNTEIEEALLLHVHALSEDEREEISRQDPAVAEMVERAAATTPEQIMDLHGRLELKDPEPGHPNPGELEVEVDRGVIRKGGRVILRPKPNGRDLYDTLLAGRTATVERIYYDYDDEIHVGVTVDGDASQELFRETGRYIFFKGHEVEPVATEVDARG